VGKSGPTSTDRGKAGVKRSLLTEGHGVPIGLATAGANRNDMKLVRQQEVFTRALSHEELATVLVALRAGVTDEQVPTARRALKAFVERVVVKGNEFRINYRADLL
jgi:hypothetical protein